MDVTPLPFCVGQEIKIRSDIVGSNRHDAYDLIFNQIAGRSVTVVDLGYPWREYVTLAWCDRNGREREISLHSGVVWLMGTRADESRPIFLQRQHVER